MVGQIRSRWCDTLDVHCTYGPQQMHTQFKVEYLKQRDYSRLLNVDGRKAVDPRKIENKVQEWIKLVEDRSSRGFSWVR
jgi:hypothetical protein